MMQNYSFSKILRNYRLYEGLTQRQMAQQLEISESHERNIESENAHAGLSVISRFFEISDVGVESLLPELGTLKICENCMLKQEITKITESLSPESKEYLINCLITMARDLERGI